MDQTYYNPNQITQNEKEYLRVPHLNFLAKKKIRSDIIIY